MNRVLVTGASGFIGSHCVSALIKRDFEVHATSPRPQNFESNGVDWYAADLLDPRQLRELVSTVRPTHLLHLAWYAHPGKYWNSEQNLVWLNASLDLLRAFSAAGGRRFVGAGSCAEYEWGGVEPLSETVTPLKPASLYGTCKHAFRTVLESYAAQEDLSAAWGRIFFVYGPREHESRLVASVIRSLLRGETARCSHGQQVRDFLYVADAAEALATLVDNEVQGPVNIGSGQPTRVRDVVSEIGSQLNLQELIEFNALTPPPGEPMFLVADTARRTQELSWQPEYTLREGIENSINWWRRNE